MGSASARDCFVAALLAITTVAAAPASITVFAAASLTEPFTAIGRLLEQRHPEWRVRFNFAGSQTLATQIELGASADVFASADSAWMSHVQERQLLAETPRLF